MTRPIEIGRPITERGARFLEALAERVPPPWEDPRPVDQTFREIRTKVDAMSSEGKLSLLAAAASTTREDEIYLEVGTLFGASAIAASTGGPGYRLFVVDNFSQFGGSPERFLSNVDSFGVRDRIELIVSDYREALEQPLPPVGVYFFDGPHSYMDQYVALELALRFLADEALVIVDDTRWPHVRRANMDFVGSHPALTLLCDLPAPSLNHRSWWNGLQVFEYRKGADRGARDLRFAANRLLYGALQPMKLYGIYYPHVMPRVERVKKLGRAIGRRASRSLRRVR